MTLARQIVGKDGTGLATEAFGSPDDAPLVLVMGATASMLGWPDAICRALAAQQRFVLRFDHRDTGGSTTQPPGAPTYSVEDMAQDVLAVMDGWGIDRADVMGMSLGGYVAQIVALSAPDRVRSLTLLASEPLGWDGDPLPGISDRFLEHFGRFAALDWQDHQAVATMMLDTSRLCAVNPAHLDEAAERETIARVLARSDSPQSAFNHGMVTTAKDWTGRARDITCPTLVLHGSLDPILPLPNGEALAATIPGARLVVLGGMGHALPSSFHSEIITEIGGFLALVAEGQGART